MSDAAGGADGGRPSRQQHSRGNNRQAMQSSGGLQQHQPQSQQQQHQSQQTRQPAPPKGHASGAGWAASGNAGMRGQPQQPSGSMAAALQALTSPTYSASASNDQHAAPFSRPHTASQPQRFTHTSVGVTQPLFARSPHPRMASSEGLNITAPAFVPTPSGMDGGGFVGGFEQGGEGGSEMDGQYGEMEYGRGGGAGGGGGGVNGQTHAAYQQRYSK